MAKNPDTQPAGSAGTPAPAETNPEILRNFGQFLQTQEDGDLHHALTEALQEIVTHLVDAHLNQGGKPKAGLTLKLNFKLDAGVLEVTGDFTTTLPKAARGRSIYWTLEGGQLSRSNPRQYAMFRDVSHQTQVRDVTGA